MKSSRADVERESRGPPCVAVTTAATGSPARYDFLFGRQLEEAFPASFTVGGAGEIGSMDAVDDAA
jgi:hypothetical protein